MKHKIIAVAFYIYNIYTNRVSGYVWMRARARTLIKMCELYALRTYHTLWLNYNVCFLSLEMWDKKNHSLALKWLIINIIQIQNEYINYLYSIRKDIDTNFYSLARSLALFI